MFGVFINVYAVLLRIEAYMVYYSTMDRSFGEELCFFPGWREGSNFSNILLTENTLATVDFLLLLICLL
jgi:hypothetical protein